MDNSKAEKLFERLQYGDLNLNFTLENAIILVGLSKMGKTTCGHFLTQETSLRGFQNESLTVCFKIEAGQNMYKTAKIGNIDDKSETEIPNFFYPKSLPDKTALIDFPGYHDSSGCFKMISNSYFHYRTFSKVKNIKFVIVMEIDSYKTTAKEVARTISSFIEGFDDFNEYEKDIFEATCFMITKVPKKKDLNFVKTRIRDISPSFENPSDRNIYQRLKMHILEKDKIFIFKEAEIGQPAPTSDALTKIHEKTTFWERQKVKDKISMKGLKISANSLIQERLNKTTFKGEWKELTNLFEEKFKKIIQELEEFFEIFIKETFNDSQENMSLQFIKSVYLKQIVPLEQNNQSYRQYEEKREEVRNQLFKNLSKSTTSTGKTPLWLKKMRTAGILNDIANQMSKTDSDEYRNIETRISQIVRFLISYAEIYSKIPEVKKYAYRIYRFFQNSKVFYKIMQPNSNNPPKSNEFNFILSNFPYSIKDLFIRIYEEPFLVKKVHYYEKKKMVENYDSQIQAQIQIEFEEALNQISKDQNLSPDMTQSVHNLKIKKLLTSADRLQNQLKELSNRGSTNIEKLSFVLGDALILREEVFTNLEESRNRMEKDQDMIALMMRLINYLGDCLIRMDRLDLAKPCFASVANAFKILEVYAKEYTQKSKKNLPKKEKLRFLMEYMRIAKKYERLELAVQLAQEAFDISQTLSDFKNLKECAEFIKGIAMRRREHQVDQFDYISEIFEEYYYKPLSQKTLKQISDVARYKNFKGTPTTSPMKKK